MAERDLENGDPADANGDFIGVKSVPVGIQQRSTRDLEECVRVDLRTSISPALLERLRGQANVGPPPPIGLLNE
jgi:hypothetical protein